MRACPSSETLTQPSKSAFISLLCSGFNLSFVPLSLAPLQEKPRTSAISFRCPRMPGIDVSKTDAKHFWLKSAMMRRKRALRPSESTPETKSSNHRWLGPCGITTGALVPIARLRLPGLRKSNFLRSRARRVSSSSPPSHHASAGYAPTVAKPPPF